MPQAGKWPYYSSIIRNEPSINLAAGNRYKDCPELSTAEGRRNIKQYEQLGKREVCRSEDLRISHCSIFISAGFYIYFLCFPSFVIQLKPDPCFPVCLRTVSGHFQSQLHAFKFQQCCGKYNKSFCLGRSYLIISIYRDISLLANHYRLGRLFFLKKKTILVCLCL